MRLRAAMALTIELCVVGGAPVVRAQDQQHPSDTASKPAVHQPTVQQPAAQQPAAPTPLGTAPKAADPAQDAKPATAQPASAKKPRKVIDNDNIDDGALFRQSGLLEIDLTGINDCDRNCFDHVHNAAGIPPSGDLQWKHDLLRGIETVRADGRWQGALLDIARVKEDFCRLERDKNDELTKHADPKNVTEAELAIDEEYQRKFEAAQKRLSETLVAADLASQKYKGLVGAFTTMQKQRVVGAACIQPRPVYRQLPDDADDP